MYLTNEACVDTTGALIPIVDTIDVIPTIMWKP